MAVRNVLPIDLSLMLSVVLIALGAWLSLR